MRTNIVLDDNLIDRARQLTGLTTKRAVIEEALQLLVSMYEQEQIRNLRGKLHWEGNLNQLRENRIDYTS
ncbi:MAG: type II toxin-antitoxin system VapB family antitoxin [Anaerolineae bacterium]